MSTTTHFIKRVKDPDGTERQHQGRNHASDDCRRATDDTAFACANNFGSAMEIQHADRASRYAGKQLRPSVSVLIVTTMLIPTSSTGCIVLTLAGTTLRIVVKDGSSTERPAADVIIELRQLMSSQRGHIANDRFNDKPVRLR